MPDNTQRPGDTGEFSGANRLFKSRAVQLVKNKMDDGTLSDFIDDWKWIFNFSRKYKWSIVFYTILGIASSSFGLASSVLGKYLVDIVTGYRTDRLAFLIFAMIFSMAFRVLLSSLVKRCSAKLEIYVNNDIQAYIYDGILEADWYELGRYASGDLLNRFNSDVRTVAANAVSWLPNVLIALYTFAATFAVLFYYDHFMALIALLSTPFLLLTGRFIMRKNREYRTKVLQLNSQMMTFEAETFYNIDTIKSFAVGDQFGRKMRGLQGNYREANLDYNLFSIKTNILTSSLSAGVYFIAFGYCLFRLWTNSITYGTMSLFLSQQSSLSGSFATLAAIFPGMLNSSISAHRVREIAQLPREKRTEGELFPDEAAKKGFEVRMTGVDFGYAGQPDVIRNSDLVAGPGEIIALVGPSGEGKTTIIRLILGLIHPQRGNVTLTDFRGKQLETGMDTRRYFSYVPQGNSLLSGTVAENLRVGKEDATDEEIEEALKTACAWDFVSSLDGGIHAVLGERGKGVSEGQAQRIAIARAALRDAPVLILDEATSALDVETEHQVLGNLIRQHPNRTCIVATHRPAVRRLCRRVYRVVDGKTEQMDPAEDGDF